MNYGGKACEISLNKELSSTALNNRVLELTKMYKVPGMFDIQNDIKKQTEAVLKKIGESKDKIFKEVQQVGKDVEKSKNAILAAQSMMLNDLRNDNARIFKGLSGLQSAMEAAFERERNERIYATEQGQNVLIKTIGDANRKVLDSLNRLTGRVIENRYFTPLKLNVPVFQDKFEKMMQFGGAAQKAFSDYLKTHEQDFLVSKESTNKAITAKSDSFVMAQMQINMIDGCTDKYTALILSTWSEMLEIHLSLTTMQQWDLNYRIQKSTNQADITYLKQLQESLTAETQSDTNEFKEVIKKRSCPAFSLAELKGSGCDTSVTYPGQSVPMTCSDSNKALILASSRKTISQVECKSDSNWSEDVNDLVCVEKCDHGGQRYSPGEKRKLPSPAAGHHWLDKDGFEITESTCLGKRTPYFPL
jgi:hypothetical protein